MLSHYTVTGMTCDHCRAHVVEEVSAVPGVEAVEVDLASGAMAVTSAGGVPFAAIADAVAEAGDYTVAPV